MGQSRSNPRSPAYKGTLPDLMIGAKVGVVTEPNVAFVLRLQAWQADTLNAGKDPPTPTEGEWDAVVYLIGEMTRPIALKDRLHWPHGEAQIAELLRMPFEEFTGRIEMACPHVRADAAPVIETPPAGRVIS